MPKVQFIFAIHNHQPVGNFDFVAEDAYQKSYLPFINVLEHHPKIKIVLHYTGILYHLFEKFHPEFIEKLRMLVADGRAEILSGGFYEPILAVLHDDDKIGQIRTLSAYIHRKISYDRKACGLRSGFGSRMWRSLLPRQGSAMWWSTIFISRWPVCAMMSWTAIISRKNKIALCACSRGASGFAI